MSKNKNIYIISSVVAVILIGLPLLYFLGNGLFFQPSSEESKVSTSSSETAAGENETPNSSTNSKINSKKINGDAIPESAKFEVNFNEEKNIEGTTFKILNSSASTTLEYKDISGNKKSVNAKQGFQIVKITILQKAETNQGGIIGTNNIRAANSNILINEKLDSYDEITSLDSNWIISARNDIDAQFANLKTEKSKVYNYFFEIPENESIEDFKLEVSRTGETIIEGKEYPPFQVLFKLK